MSYNVRLLEGVETSGGRRLNIPHLGVHGASPRCRERRLTAVSPNANTYWILPACLIHLLTSKLMLERDRFGEQRL